MSSVAALPAVIRDAIQEHIKAYPNCEGFRVVLSHADSADGLDTDIFTVSLDSSMGVEWKLRGEDFNEGTLEKFVSTICSRTYAAAWVAVAQLDENDKRLRSNVYLPSVPHTPDASLMEYLTKTTEYGRQHLPFINKYFAVSASA
jgi:hypothetical protein